MSEFKTLFMFMLKNSFRGFKNSLGRNGKGENKSNMRFFLLAIILIALPIIYLAPFAFISGGLARENGIVPDFFTLLLLLLAFVLFIASISYLLNVMYFNKDTQLLLSMPFKGSTIFYVKLLVVYLYLEAITILVTLSFGITFGIGSGLGWSYYIGLIILMPIMPLLPLFFSVMLSPLFVAIATIIKRNVVFMVIAVIIAIGAFVGLYFLLFSGIDFFNGINFEESGQAIASDIVSNIKNIAKGIFFLNAFSNLFISNSSILLSILIIVGMNILYVGASLPMIKFMYRKGVSKQLESGSGSKRSKKGLITTGQSVNSALVKKELRSFFRAPIFLFYSLFQIVMPFILVVIFSMTFSTVESSEINPQIMQIIQVCTMTMSSLVFSCGINYMAITCVSREGKNLAILKSLPIDIKKQLNIKVYLSFALSALSIIFISIGMVILQLTSTLNIIFFTVFSLIMALSATYIQAHIDVKKPRLDWENITQLLQNNANLLKSMLYTFVLTIIFSLLFTVGVLVISPLANADYGLIIVWSVILVCATIYFFIAKTKYSNNIVKDFENIET